jgi:hypothetical protein
MLPRLAFLVLCCSALVTAAELKVNRLFSDHAVLQAGELDPYAPEWVISELGRSLLASL